MASLRAAFALLPLLLAAAQLGAASSAALTEAEMLQPPTSARLKEFCAEAKASGWGKLTPMFHEAARHAYEKDRLPAAERWYQAYRWSALFAETEVQFIPQWIKDMEAAHTVHANLPQRYTAKKRQLGQWLSPQLQAWLVVNGKFSNDFFALLSPLDYLPDVFRILDELHQRDPARFERYANLALALAVVYDLPPPPDWPHGQASAASLPRHWPAAGDAFDWWILQDQMDRSYLRLDDLRADELKFVVDAAAPLTDLRWAQQNVDYPLNHLDKAYTLIRYRTDRADRGVYIWPNGSYTLPAILADGGICVDQAYFASEVGKARGVPTLLFLGAGMDGRHAWFGFLDRNQHWQLNAGRYDEQRFVTGFARDPQTWKEISDHELQFLSERFRSLPAYRSSRVHEVFAEDYLQAGENAVAIRAAWKALRLEPRNQEAWETVLTAQRAQHDGAKAIEATLYQAVAAFGNYADLEAAYSARLCQSLRGRGQLSAADFEEERILSKYRQGRSDLALAQATDHLQWILTTRPLAEAIRTYNTLVDTQGRGGGIDFFDAIVAPFALHLAHMDHAEEARAAVSRAYAMLSIPPGSQLESEFSRLFKELKPVESPIP
ncbi:MAG: hypothetical protein ABI222_03320 [Opitutaceae bacterium]